MKLKNTRSKLLAVLLIVTVLVMALAACGKAPSGDSSLQGDIAIYHAGSLSVPFEDMTTEFNKIYPNINVTRDSGGSSTQIRKITELGKIGDILASADYALIPGMMSPDYADWYIIFAYNRMVLCYTDQSQYADEIDGDNWYEILARDGVVYGHSDPDQDPCGYRTLMVWQLAEKHYNVHGLYDSLDIEDIHKNVTRPKSVELIALLQSGDMDYAFEYLSVAKQHELNYVELPREIDLSEREFKDFYANAKVDVAGSEPGTTKTLTAAPIVYGLTIPTNAASPELAAKFIAFLISKEGNAIMERNFQAPVVPAVASDKSLLPKEVAKLCTE
jgi:molybdate/tungstate transport system substrate-binding protein